jgi:hypothetical protein
MQAVEDIEEKKHGMTILIRHLESCPERVEKRMQLTEDVFRKVAILRLDISEFTGKENADDE